MKNRQEHLQLKVMGHKLLEVSNTDSSPLPLEALYEVRQISNKAPKIYSGISLNLQSFSLYSLFTYSLNIISNIISIIIKKQFGQNVETWLNSPVTVLAVAPPVVGLAPVDLSDAWLAGWSDKIVLPRATACWGALVLATPSCNGSLWK